MDPLTGSLIELLLSTDGVAPGGLGPKMLEEGAIPNSSTLLILLVASNPNRRLLERRSKISSTRREFDLPRRYPEKKYFGQEIKLEIIGK